MTKEEQAVNEFKRTYRYADIIHKEGHVKSFMQGWQAALESQPKWISVEEQLPETDDEVMVYVTDDGGNIVVDTYCPILKDWRLNGKRFPKYTTLHYTHWQYFPPKP